MALIAIILVELFVILALFFVYEPDCTNYLGDSCIFISVATAKLMRILVPYSRQLKVAKDFIRSAIASALSTFESRGGRMVLPKHRLVFQE